jgi:hypothetical protein
VANAFAAGAAFGGPIGTLSNLSTGNPANLLNKTTDPITGAASTGVDPTPEAPVAPVMPQITPPDKQFLLTSRFSSPEGSAFAEAQQRAAADAAYAGDASAPIQPGMEANPNPVGVPAAADPVAQPDIGQQFRPAPVEVPAAPQEDLATFAAKVKAAAAEPIATPVADSIPDFPSVPPMAPAPIYTAKQAAADVVAAADRVFAEAAARQAAKAPAPASNVVKFPAVPKETPPKAKVLKKPAAPVAKTDLPGSNRPTHKLLKARETKSLKASAKEAARARRVLTDWVNDLPDDDFNTLVAVAGGEANLLADIDAVTNSTGTEIKDKINAYSQWIRDGEKPTPPTNPTKKPTITVVPPAVAKAEKPAGDKKLQEKGTKATKAAEPAPVIKPEPPLAPKPVAAAKPAEPAPVAAKVVPPKATDEYAILSVENDIARILDEDTPAEERKMLFRSLEEATHSDGKDVAKAKKFFRDYMKAGKWVGGWDGIKVADLLAAGKATDALAVEVKSAAGKELKAAPTPAEMLATLLSKMEAYVVGNNIDTLMMNQPGPGDLWRAVREGVGANAEFRNVKLRDFFTKEGRIEQSKLLATRTEEEQIVIDDGAHFREDGKPVGKPMEIGKLTMLVNNFRARLHVAPKFSVFRNQADLKARNPDLYKEAKAAYPGGDFDNIRSSGFAFKKQVLVFSDEIADATHLRFVLGHEALGHFGFRAIMDTKTRLAMLDKVYNSANMWVKNGIDRYADMHSIDRQEATEEYLANEAANLDNSLVHMIWNAITKVLEKIGIKLPGEAARYMIRQARRYVLNGADGQHFNPEIMAQRLEAMEDEAATGSFDRVTDSTGAVISSIRDGSIDTGAFDERPGFLERLKKNPWTTVVDSAVAFNYNWGSVLEKVQTLDAMARLSEGLTNIFKKFQEVDLFSKKLVSDSNQITHTQNSFKTKKADRDKASAMLRLSRRVLTIEKGSDRDVDKFIDELPDLLEFNEDGSPIYPWEATTSKDHHLELKFNNENLQKAFDAGTMTPAQLTAAIKKYGEMTGNNRITYAALPVGEKITADSVAYRIYYENRVAVAKAAVELLISHHIAARMEVDTAADSFLKAILRSNDEKVVLTATDAERKAVDKIITTYKKLKDTDAEEANKLLVNVTNALKDESNLEKWRKIASDPKYTDWADLTPHIETLNEKNQKATKAFDALDPEMVDRLNKERIWATMRAVTNYALSSSRIESAIRRAKQTISMGYVPFNRRGKYQMNIIARAEDGTIFNLAPEMTKNTGYWRDDDRGRLNGMANAIQEAVKGKYTLLDSDGVAHENATLTVGVSEARTVFTHDNTSIYDVLDVIRRAGMNIKPEENTKLVTLITNEDNAARKALHATMKPGEDPDMLRSISEYLEGQARIAAKEVNRNQIQAIMDDSSQWLGNKKKLTDLAKAVETAVGENAKRLAQRAYDQYAFMYKNMATGDTVMINGKQHKTLGNGERYRNQGEKLLEWYSSSINIQTSPEDTLVSAAAGRVRSFVTGIQLGGSIAVGILNMFSLVTNSYNYLAAYNPQNGFGLGHGLKAATMLTSTLIQMRGPRYGDIIALREMQNKKEWASWGLTEDEAQFLLEQTENGSLSAMEATALLQTARGFRFNPQMAKVFEKWMLPFTYTEQLNRRTTALSAYRLEMARLQGIEGMSAADKYRIASDEAHKAVITTQGEYAMYNRPELARGNVLSHVFMYKQFSIQMIELMAALPHKQRLIMLGMLFLMAGLKGLPFADDLMDLFDTLMQFFQIKMGPVEAVIGELIGDIGIPGIDSHTALRGFLDKIGGLTVSTRLGLGDQLPLTGVFRAGADPWREMTNFIGPMWGGVTGIANDAYALTNWSIGTITGLDTGSAPGRKGLAGLEDILRNSPVALARALGDTLVYASSGDILTRAGKVVTNDVTIQNLVGRIAGFYPASATRANDIVRLNKALGDYSKSVRTAFTQDYVKYAITGDRDGMREILRRVKEWNRAAKGTGLELPNFVAGAQTSLKSARQTTIQRSLKALPKSVRPYAQEIADINGMPQ